MTTADTPQIELIEACLARFHAGDTGAADELAAITYRRLTELIAAALRRFPDLRGVLAADEVLHGPLLKRLQSALYEVRPTTASHLFALASKHIRWEILDLIRRQRRERQVVSLQAIAGEEGRAYDPEDPRTDAEARLANLERFNETVEQLPDELRQVLDLLYFQRLSQQEAATILGVTDRTVRNRLQAAKEEIRRLLGECDWLE